MDLPLITINQIQLLKSQLDQLRPFDQSQLKNLKEWFRIGFIHHSNALEGNTLTLQEVKLVIEEGITIGGKTVQELQETINHGELMKYLQDFFQEKKLTISQEFIQELHKMLVQGRIKKEQTGIWRTSKVYISGSEDILPPPQELDTLMQEYCTNYSNIQSLEECARVHYDFVKIHPFIDGNGRIARILMNLALVALGYFPIIIPKTVRGEYIQSLQGDNFSNRYKFFLWQVYENHKDYIRFLTNK